MTVKQAISVLKKHNNWRRGGRGSQQDPKIIGEAIDVAIEVMEQFLKDKPSMNRCRIDPKRHE